MEILFKEYIQDTLWYCNQVLNYEEQLLSDSLTTHKAYMAHIYQETGINLEYASCVVLRLEYLRSAHVTSFGYENNRFLASPWSGNNSLKAYLALKFLCKQENITRAEDAKKFFGCAHVHPTITYPIDGESIWDDELRNDAFWRNEKRFRFVEFIRDELEYLLRNGKLRNDFPGIFGEIV